MKKAKEHKNLTVRKALGKFDPKKKKTIKELKKKWALCVPMIEEEKNLLWTRRKLASEQFINRCMSNRLFQFTGAKSWFSSGISPQSSWPPRLSELTLEATLSGNPFIYYPMDLRYCEANVFGPDLLGQSQHEESELIIEPPSEETGNARNFTWVFRYLNPGSAFPEVGGQGIRIRYQFSNFPTLCNTSYAMMPWIEIFGTTAWESQNEEVQGNPYCNIWVEINSEASSSINQVQITPSNPQYSPNETVNFNSDDFLIGPSYGNNPDLNIIIWIIAYIPQNYSIAMDLQVNVPYVMYSCARLLPHAPLIASSSSMPHFYY